MTSAVDVLVIGGGQAGLSAAFHLQRTGVDYLLVDAEPGAGGAWQHRWPTLTMATVNGIRELPGSVVPFVSAQTPANEAIPSYFGDYERQFDLRIQRPVRVMSVNRGELGFDVTTSAGLFRARAVINATGTWTKPFWPAIPGMAEFAGRQLHTHDYPGPSPFAGQRVIVVGGGISGLQSLMEIGPVAAGTTWVTRRPPVFIEREFTPELGRAAVAMVAERVEAGLPPASVVSVTGLGWSREVEAAQEAGYLDRLPMFTRLDKGGAVWPDRRRDADVVLWATGFRAALDHLAPLRLRAPGGGIVMRGTQVAIEPRLHLVGYGPSASTVGANRAGRAAVAALRRELGLTSAA